MDWLSQNWIWVVVAVIFFASHLFGHGGHGGRHGRRPRQPDEEPERAPGRSRSVDGSGHTH